MNEVKPLLSGVAATVVGAIGTILAAASVAIPQPWGFFAGLVGFIAAALAGSAVAPPKVVEGAAHLQGAALTVAGSLAGLLTYAWPSIPAGWPQSLAMAAAALLSWATGKAMPQLGSAVPPSVPVAGVSQAADVFNRGK